MLLVRVQYDGYNRQFKLLDRDLVGKLEDGASYLLIADISTEDVISAQNLEEEAEAVLVGGS